VGDLKKKLLGAASILLNVEEEELVFEEALIRTKSFPKRGISLAQAVIGPGVNRGSVMGAGVYQTKGSMDKETGQGLGLLLDDGSGGAEVEVDKVFGSVKVNKYIGVADAGKAINPAGSNSKSLARLSWLLDRPLARRWFITATE